MLLQKQVPNKMSDAKSFCVVFLFIINIITVLAQFPPCTENQCISVTECAPVLAILQKTPVTQENIKYLRQLQCNYKSSTPKVCCPTENTTTDALDEEEKTEKDSFILLPGRDVCGKLEDNRIIGGEVTGINEFPWLALLEYEKPGGELVFNCGGSLINNRYVLTAAHCIRNIPTEWKLKSVRLGEYNVSRQIDCEELESPVEYCADPPVNIDVEEQIAHEMYHPGNRNHAYDIALLRLKEEVNFTEFITPICLPISINYEESLRNNKNYLTVVGWGVTENNTSSDIKLKTQIPAVPESECFSFYEKKFNLQLNDSQICAGGVQGKDSCRGDSGGPLMMVNTSKTEQNWFIFGIVSFGVACGVGEFPGVYTKVSSYNQWLMDNLKP